MCDSVDVSLKLMICLDLELDTSAFLLLTLATPGPKGLTGFLRVHLLGNVVTLNCRCQLVFVKF